MFLKCVWNRHTENPKVRGRRGEKADAQVTTWRLGGDEPRLGNQTAGERSRTKGVIDEAVFHSLDCARGRVSSGAHTLHSQPASHQDLIIAALTSANRLWNMEWNTARPWGRWRSRDQAAAPQLVLEGSAVVSTAALCRFIGDSHNTYLSLGCFKKKKKKTPMKSILRSTLFAVWLGCLWPP